jgi:hypothetical protein
MKKVLFFLGIALTIFGTGLLAYAVSYEWGYNTSLIVGVLLIVAGSTSYALGSR